MIFPGSMVQNLYLNPTVATSFRILYSRCQKFPYLSKYKYQQSMSPSSPSLSPDEPELSVEEARSSCLCHFPPTRTTPRVLSTCFSSWSESPSEPSDSLAASASSSLLPRSSPTLQLQVQLVLRIGNGLLCGIYTQVKHND